MTRPTRPEFKAALAALITSKKDEGKKKPSFRQHRRAKAPTPARIVAYDFETTNIPMPGQIKAKTASATPRPVYLTAYGEDYAFAASISKHPITGMKQLRQLLIDNFLTEEMHGTKFVAWNGNNYDAFFIAAALVQDPTYILRPYMTRSKSIRGLRISLAEDKDNPRSKRSWEFLDGIAMLGLAGVSLDAFLKTFAPNHLKLTGTIDFERGEQFDSNNPAHCDYAMQDSVGLYHGMQRAQQILMDQFDQPLTVTMGGACIKIFQSYMPRDVIVNHLDDEAESIVRQYVMRGGFCYCVKRYHGPIWKYDINQAYASAMREAMLPCGSMYHVDGLHKSALVYIAKCTATSQRNKIPFYYRTIIDGRLRTDFAMREINETWLTSIEINQLKREGWKVDITESYQWTDHFNMCEFVDRLEHTRTNCEGGPKGAVGTMIKMVGCHSYGKTVEQIDPVEFLLAPECPESSDDEDDKYKWQPYYGDESEPMDHVFFRFVKDQREKVYHKPQLGAFITAHVRMVLRRAALLAPEQWLYADTDCVVFSRDVTSLLDIDSARYGAWKIEEEGTHYRITAKKVYSQDESFGIPDFVGPPSPFMKRSAKGLHVKKLTAEDFARWHDGLPPSQDQVQKQNFIAVLRGAEMFREQTRRGTAIFVET